METSARGENGSLSICSKWEPHLPPDNQTASRTSLLRRARPHVTFLLIAASTMWAQSQSSTPPGDNGEPQSESQAEPSGDIPQISEQPSENPDSGEASTSDVLSEARSLLQLGVHASEGMQTNPSGLLGYSSQYSPVTNLFGSARLRDVKRHSTSALDYMGGGLLYDGYGSSGFFDQQIQQLGASQSFQSGKWRFSLRDTFRYLSEGSFGTSTINSTNQGADSGESPTNSSPSNVPSPPVTIGQDSFLVNSSGIEFSQALSRRSSLFASGNYSLINYFNTSQSLYNIRQASGAGGYKYQLNRKDTVGILYQYQNFRYPSGGLGTIATNTVEVTYQRAVTGRMSLSVNAGPEFTDLNNGKNQPTREIGFTARASIAYNWKLSTLNGLYSHQVSGGSGLFAGVDEDVAGALFSRSIHRVWNVSVDGGYTRGKQIGSALPGQRLGSFAFESAGGTVRRLLGPYLSVFGTYGFSGENFSNCVVSLGCEPVLHRHTVLIGLDWYLRPISLQ